MKIKRNCIIESIFFSLKQTVLWETLVSPSPAQQRTYLVNSLWGQKVKTFSTHAQLTICNNKYRHQPSQLVKMKWFRQEHQSSSRGLEGAN